jgi:hypothetical protein
MNIEGIPLVLDKYNIEITQINSYLFIMFFLQRCQLIGNIIRIFLPDCKDCMKYGIKYCIMNNDFGDLTIKIKEFKQEFQQEEIISEILTFIRASMEKKTNYRKIEYEIKSLKLQNYITNFTTIKDILKDIDKEMIQDEDISNFKNQYYNYAGTKNIEKEIIKLEANWIKYKESKNKKNNELFVFVQEWYDL